MEKQLDGTIAIIQLNESLSTINGKIFIVNIHSNDRQPSDITMRIGGHSVTASHPGIGNTSYSSEKHWYPITFDFTNFDFTGANVIKFLYKPGVTSDGSITFRILIDDIVQINPTKTIGTDLGNEGANSIGTYNIGQDQYGPNMNII